MNKKKLITMIICSVMALNIGVVSVFADDGGATSLDGHGPSDISTSTGGSNTKAQAGNGKVDVDINAPSQPPSSSNKPGGSTGSKDTNKNPSSNETAGNDTPGASTGGGEVLGPPEWQISEGWQWSLNEWGNRNDWFTDNKDGSLIDRIKTIFWGDKEADKSGEIKEEVTYDVSETSHVSSTDIRRNRRLIRYDWTITNKTDSSIPVEYAKSPSLTLKWIARYTGKYNAIAKPWCRWDVGYETTHTVTVTGSDGTVSTSTYTVFHKTGEVEEYYTPGIKQFNFTIGLKDIGRETELPPKEQVNIEAIYELVE